MDLTLYLYAIPFFLILILIEFSYGIFHKKNTYESEDAICSLSTGMIMMTSSLLSKSMILTIYLWVYQHFAIWQPELTTSNLIMLAILYYVGVDFLYYWFHRACHEVNLFWAVHQTHHSSEDYNLSTALRQSATQGLFSQFFYLPLAILGCPPMIYFALVGVNTLYQFWVHTQHINKMGWLEKIFVTPSHHRVHHAQNPEYLDKNHGAMLIIWDKWFGTFAEENTPIVYGVTKPLRTFDPVWANFVGFADLMKDTFAAKKWRDKIKLWFMSPGWRPADLGGMPTHDIKQFSKYHAPQSIVARWFGWFSLLSLIGLLMYVISYFNALSTTAKMGGLGVIVLGLWLLGRVNSSGRDSVLAKSFN